MVDLQSWFKYRFGSNLVTRNTHRLVANAIDTPTVLEIVAVNSR